MPAVDLLLLSLPVGSLLLAVNWGLLHGVTKGSPRDHKGRTSRVATRDLAWVRDSALPAVILRSQLQLAVEIGPNCILCIYLCALYDSQTRLPAREQREVHTVQCTGYRVLTGYIAWKVTSYKTSVVLWSMIFYPSVVLICSGKIIHGKISIPDKPLYVYVLDQ